MKEKLKKRDTGKALRKAIKKYVDDVGVDIAVIVIANTYKALKSVQARENMGKDSLHQSTGRLTQSVGSTTSEERHD